MTEMASSASSVTPLRHPNGSAGHTRSFSVPTLASSSPVQVTRHRTIYNQVSEPSDSLDTARNRGIPTPAAWSTPNPGPVAKTEPALAEAQETVEEPLVKPKRKYSTRGTHRKTKSVSATLPAPSLSLDITSSSQSAGDLHIPPSVWSQTTFSPVRSLSSLPESRPLGSGSPTSYSSPFGVGGPLHPSPTTTAQPFNSDPYQAAPVQSTDSSEIKTAEGKKMFVCQGHGDCRMAFSRSEHLARHIRKHTGERPFKCHCGRDFSRLDNLRQHAQTVHADHAEANQEMLTRLKEVHDALSRQSSTRKRKQSAKQKSTLQPTGLASSGTPGSTEANVAQNSPLQMPPNLTGAFLPAVPSPLLPADYLHSHPHHGGHTRSQSDSFLMRPPPTEPYLSGYPDPHAYYGLYPAEIDVQGRPTLPSISALIPRSAPGPLHSSMPMLPNPMYAPPPPPPGYYTYHEMPAQPPIPSGSVKGSSALGDLSRPLYLPSSAAYPAYGPNGTPSVLAPFAPIQGERSLEGSVHGSPAVGYHRSPIHASRPFSTADDVTIRLESSTSTVGPTPSLTSSLSTDQGSANSPPTPQRPSSAQGDVNSPVRGFIDDFDALVNQQSLIDPQLRDMPSFYQPLPKMSVQQIPAQSEDRSTGHLQSPSTASPNGFSRSATPSFTHSPLIPLAGGGISSAPPSAYAGYISTFGSPINSNGKRLREDLLDPDLLDDSFSASKRHAVST